MATVLFFVTVTLLLTGFRHLVHRLHTERVERPWSTERMAAVTNESLRFEQQSVVTRSFEHCKLCVIQ